MELKENQEKLNRILKDLFAYFCPYCIQNICNQALTSIYKLEIVPEHTASCYLMFLQEKILNIEIECPNKSLGCNKRIKYGELTFHLRLCKSYSNSLNNLNKKFLNNSQCDLINPLYHLEFSPEIHKETCKNINEEFCDYTVSNNKNIIKKKLNKRKKK